MITTTVAPGSRTIALKLINRYMPVFQAGMHTADDLTLQHEAERLEGQEPSPVNTRMKQIVDAELRERRHPKEATTRG